MRYSVFTYYRAFYRIWLLLLLFSFMFCQSVIAQTPEEDLVTVEAWIDYHKKISSVLLTRSVLEELATITHQNTEDEARDFKRINTELDKYNKCFDLIDALLRTSAAVGNAYLTYNVVSERLKEYQDLVQDYKDICLKRGNLFDSDTIIVTLSLRVVQDVVELSQQLLVSVGASSFYRSGLLHCTAAEFIEVVDMVNTYLDTVRKVVNDAYMFMWRYIFMRTHYWKPDVFGAKSVREMANDALQRWIDNAKKASK